MNKISWIEKNDECELAATLAEDIAQHLQAKIDSRGQAIIAFSGGSTPVPLFQALCRTELDWRSVIVTLVDERWVPETHTLSNAGLLHSHLLSALPMTRFVPLYQVAASVKESLSSVLESYTQITASSPNNPAAFDAVILGMGGDGHTASFFPDATNIEELVDIENRSILQSCESHSTQVPRVTWSLASLLSTDFLALHFTGEEKRRVFERASKTGDFKELPVRAVIHQKITHLMVYYSN